MVSGITKMREILRMQAAQASCILSHMDVDETFRRNLRALREERGMNLDQLSKKAGINRRGARDIEEGKSKSPKLSTVFQLAKALDVSVAELTGEQAPPQLHAELVEFLRQYDQEQQERLLGALRAFPPLTHE